MAFGIGSAFKSAASSIGSAVSSVGREVNRAASTAANVASLGLYDAIRAPDRQMREAEKQATRAASEAEQLAAEEEANANAMRQSILRAGLNQGASLFSLLGSAQGARRIGGTQRETGDGSMSRDIAGVSDAISAFQQSRQSGFSNIFNQISRGPLRG